MDHSSIILGFSDQASESFFQSAGWINTLNTLAPTQNIGIITQDHLPSLVSECISNYHCKTLIIIGENFSSDMLLQTLPSYDMFPEVEKIEEGFSILRVNQTIHICLLYDLSMINRLKNNLTSYYRIINGRTINDHARKIGSILKNKGWTIASAESCSGGLITKSLTDIPGSSAYVCGGVCTYTAAAKVGVLNVPADIISKYGVVSKETAQAMAERVQHLYHSTIAVATTGVAGPGPDSDGNPEGCVFVAVAVGKSCNIYNYAADTLCPFLDRDFIRKGCVCFAFERLLELIQE